MAANYRASSLHLQQDRNAGRLAVARLCCFIGRAVARAAAAHLGRFLPRLGPLASASGLLFCGNLGVPRFDPARYHPLRLLPAPGDSSAQRGEVPLGRRVLRANAPAASGPGDQKLPDTISSRTRFVRLRYGIATHGTSPVLRRSVREGRVAIVETVAPTAHTAYELLHTPQTQFVGGMRNWR
jgi:hypothetical protein